MNEDIQILDLRPMPPFQRHEKIFQIWDSLKAGETLKIINDHDPKPLWYQFEVEYKGKYEWKYEQKGPKDWIVGIKKKEAVMGGICNNCKYFRADIHPGQAKPHHCDFQDAALSEAESRKNCDECVPKSKSCCD